jgi:type IV secretion system protein VirD4
MNIKPASQFTWVGWLFLWPVILWFAAWLAQSYVPGQSILTLANQMAANPKPLFPLLWTDQTFRLLLLFSLSYALGIGIYYSSRRNLRPKEEHGSAQWVAAAAICRRYRDPVFAQNILLTENFRMGFNSRKHRRNLNVLVVGGSGAGKTRFYAKPNLMQTNCSFLVTDPKGELLRDTGQLLKAKGYEVKVFDLINMSQSFCYNPFQYIRDDKDVLKLVTNLIRNTTPKTAGNSDPFWEKSETALLQALMLFLYHEAPVEEQNFTMVMEMINSAEVREDDDNYASPLDILFERLEMENPDHIAVRQYGIYKQAAGKTAKSILISIGVRLAAFNLNQIASITQYDEMDLESLGQRKVALFCVIPDNDSSFNYLVGMLYTQAFQSLYYLADHHYGGRLPVHVHAVLDEFANVALPDDFEKILSTMRSREISVSIIIQNLAQLKALFKDNWESIVGNCDEFLYLGGNEQSTHEYVSKLLGKATIDTNTYGKSQGKSGSYSTNYQQTGRELLTPDEVRLLDNNDALLFVRGERPIIDRKYNLLKHPELSLTADGGQPAYRMAAEIPGNYDLSFDETRPDDFELLTEDDLIQA